MKISRSSEDLIKLIEHVSFKKTEGKLYLMDQRLAWMTNTSESFKISEPYQNIRAQRISPSTKDKVQLQLLMHTNSSFTFHFVHPDGKDAQIAARDEVKNLLQRLLPKFRDRAHAELEKKKNICLKNPSISDLYKELVANKYISKEEFWSKVEDDLKIHDDSDTHQSKGIPTWFLTSKNEKVQLSEAMIEDIFCVYPSVKDKYLECVPKTMSKEEFWKQFYQSHYYHRMRTENSSDIFSSCIEKDRNFVYQQALKLKADNKSIEQTTLDEDEICKEPTLANKFSTKIETNIESEVLHRFNRHYFFLLRQIMQNKRKLENDVDNTNQSDAKRMKHDDFYEEGMVRVKNSCSENGVPFNTENVKSFMQKLSVKSATHSQRNSFNVNTLNEHRNKLHQIKQQLDPNTSNMNQPNNSQLTQQSVSSTAADVLTQIGYCLSSSTSNNANTGTDNPPMGLSGSSNNTSSVVTKSKLISLSVDSLSQIKKLYNECFEITRHYWLCFPVTTPEKYNRLSRMADSVHKFGQNRVRPFQQTFISSSGLVGLGGNIATGSGRGRPRNNPIERTIEANVGSVSYGDRKSDPTQHLISMIDKVNESYNNFLQSHAFASREFKKYVANK